MKIVHGNLIDLALTGHFDVIVHGCNCFNTMGKGIAKSIRDTFFEAYDADSRTVRGDMAKLGGFSLAVIKTRRFSESEFSLKEERTFVVVNAYTQYDYRGPGPNVDYVAIRSVFRRIKNTFFGTRIGYPMIGAGNASGDWNIISDIIDHELNNEDHTLVIYDGS